MIDKVKTEFAKSETPEPSAIQKILGDYIAAGHTDWKEFALFCNLKYARNLIEFNENFELIILCWLPGQESPIHNHSVRAAAAKRAGVLQFLCGQNTPPLSTQPPLSDDSLILHHVGSKLLDGCPRR